MTPLEHPILRCLRSHDGPRTIADVAADTGLSRRAVEADVEDLRLQGHPIVAGPDGLELCYDPARIRAYCDARRRRELHQAVGTRRMLQAARALEAGPLTLFGSAL